MTFSVTNAGKTEHEFTLDEAAMQQQHAQLMSHIPAGMAHDTPNGITLRPGETKQLTWRWGARDTLEYACHKADQFAAGLRGRISVF